ncbi:MAG: response regulator [Cyanobacteria bacterium J06627_28]
MKFLLVEDDQALAGTIEQLLNEHHYVMDLATDGAMGRDMAEAFPYDFILLDWMLPKLDGITLCKHLRNEGNYTPIILMTARDASSDKVAGLDAGADDYLVKPFEFEELLARIRALLRRAEGLASPVLQWGDLCLDPRSSEVSCRNEPIAVTPKEYALLELFLRNPSRIFSLDNLLDKVWAYDDAPNVGSVRTHIKGLRQKLKKAGLTDIITTVYGLGYRLNTGTSQTVAPQSPSETPEMEKAAGTLNMTALWQSVSQSYLQRVDNVANTLRGLQPGLIDKATQAELLNEAHSLAGSLGSFGFKTVTTCCQTIEQLLRANAYLSTEHISQLETAITQAQRSLEQGITEASVVAQPIFTPANSPESNSISAPIPAPIELLPGQFFQLLMVEKPGETAQDWLATLQEIAGRYQMQVARVDTITQARDAIFPKASTTRPPHVVVFDFDGSHELPGNNSDEFKLLSDMQATQPPIPNIVLTAAASFENRVRVARMGVDGLLQVPVTPIDLLEAAARVLRKGVAPTARLLIVDDEPSMLTLLQSLLQPWGFQLQLLGDPNSFWQTLESFEPDLVLLDVRMPEISGFELCQVLRNAPRWCELPVLFMSGYTDADTIQQVFAVGADDYIRKPIVAPELVARVLGWLERSRNRQLMADVDNLTGVANRRKSTQSLNRLLALAQRQGQMLCFAVIDLDNFKAINDEYGHPKGDQVLKRFGDSLKSTFRDEDVVARWGGEEFVVGLYGVGRQEGVHRLRQFLQTWQLEQFETGATQTDAQTDTEIKTGETALPTFKVTFSAGVAVYPHDAADLQGLYRSADRALYQAKAAGRDRVMPVA